MNRREALIGAGAAIATMTAAKLAEAAAKGAAPAMAGHDHSAHQQGPDYTSLINAASSCHKAALACENHCLESFAAKDTSLAACAREVAEMMAICEATIRVASLKSKYTKEIVAVCKKSGESCKAECLKQAKQHDICRIMAEECDKCIKECDKVLS